MARPVVRFLADEDFNNDLLRALRRRRPQADVVRVQDVGLSGRPDPAVLAWAAEEGGVLLTHDAATLVGHALARLGTGDAMAGVLVAPQAAPAAAVVDDLELIDAAGEPDDRAGRVIFLPLRRAEKRPRVSEILGCRTPVASAAVRAGGIESVEVDP